MKMHNKGYICSVSGCSEAFSKFSQLAVHARSHGFVCEHCKKNFSAVWELKKHTQMTHASTRKTYECPREGCSRVYTKAFNLRAHIKAFHDGIRPYLCTVEGCGKGFAHKVSLRQHLVLHSQNKIKPKPPPTEKKKSKKKRKPVTLAKQLSGYRSSLSESSDTHLETAPKRKKAPSQLLRKATENTQVNTVNANSEHEGGTRQSSTNLMSSSDKITTVNDNRPDLCSSILSTNGAPETMSSEGMQVCASTAPSPSLLPSSNTTATTSSPGMQNGRVSDPFANLTPSFNEPAVTSPNVNTFDGVEVGLTSVSSPGVLSLGCGGSSTITADINRSPLQSESQKRNASAVVDEPMFSSSDEDVEGMEWDLPEDNCAVGLDHNSEHVSEDTQGDSSSFQDRIANEGCSGDRRLPGSRTVRSRKEFSGDISPAGLERSENNAKRSQKTEIKNRKRPKKSRGFDVAHTGSRSVERVSLVPPIALPTRLNVSSNSAGGNEVDVLEDTDFPGMDDVLQVIIEEEDEELTKSQNEISLNNEDINLEEDSVRFNGSVLRESNCTGKRYSENHSASSQDHHEGVSSSVEELHVTVKESYRGSGHLRATCNTQNGTSDEVGCFLVDNGVVEDDIPSDYDGVDSDDEGLDVSEEQDRVCDNSTSVTQVARDKDVLTRDTGVGNSRVSTLDKGQIARDGDSNKTSVENSHLSDSSSKDRDTDENVSTIRQEERPLSQSTNKRSSQKNDKNVVARPPSNRRTSSTPAKPAVVNAAKPRNKSSKRTTEMKAKDLEFDSEKHSQTGSKPGRNIETSEPEEDVSKAKFRSRSNPFAFDLQTLELLWNFKGK